MIFSLGLMVLGSLAISLGAMVAVNGLHQDLGSAVRGYRELRQLFSVGFFASRARDAVTTNPPQPRQAIAALQAALESLNTQSATNTVEGAPVEWLDASARRDCQDLLSKSIYEIAHGQQNSPSLNLLFPRISKISEEVRRSVVDTQAAADRKRIVSLWAIIGLCFFVVGGAIIIGAWQYRGVIGPIKQIGGGVREFAAGKFDRRIQIRGDREFVALATDFNHMANELSALYHDLEQKVHDQSKQLVRSERLASVGYLASGVAHEINNPLGIIAGYGERAIQQLTDGFDESSLPAVQKALGIICEEAFRCKQITDRLLSLARPGSDVRQFISVPALVETIISTLAGLGAVGHRKLTIEYDPQQDLRCTIHEGEMKQVFLNLILNGLEAADAAAGEVRVNIARNLNQIEVSITDNGQGMTADTLDHIFQPFFTHKRSERPGTGLGLSIAHSIVTDHGGTIWAQSAGLNLGSTFTVRLPAVSTEVSIVEN